MASIIENTVRNGNITSSSIHKIMAKGKDSKAFSAGALTYFAEKNLERKLKRSLSLDKYSRPTLWGHFLETRVHHLLGVEYESIGHITLRHPSINFWVGSPDVKNSTKSICGDIKCYEPKAFCEYVDLLEKAHEDNNLELYKKEYPSEYWQLISNAIILGMDKIEPIVYMPYEDELDELREMAHNHDGADQYKYRFIAEAHKSELAYLPKDSGYKNLNRFVFDNLHEDKKLLTDTVLRAKNYLI